MYLRCSSESKPTWNGKNRILFQNNSNHRPAMRSSGICSSHRGVDLLRLTLQRKTAIESIAIRTIKKGQDFFATLSVPLLLAIELPAPVVFSNAATTPLGCQEPAIHT